MSTAAAGKGLLQLLQCRANVGCVFRLYLGYDKISGFSCHARSTFNVFILTHSFMYTHIYPFSFCWLSDVIPAQHLMQSKREEPQQPTVNPNFETPEKSLNPKHNPALRNSGYTLISPPNPKGTGRDFASNRLSSKSVRCLRGLHFAAHFASHGLGLRAWC